MLNEVTDQLWFVSQPGNCQTQFAAEFRLIMASNVASLDILQLIPDRFVRVQIGCLAG